MNRLKLPDLDLAYRREGAGPPLILLHGWPEWSAIWRRVMPGLAERHDVIAPDLRNFGDSTGAEARDVEHYVDDLAALADALDLDRFGIVSHDVGAFLAQDYARRHPNRLAGLFFFDCPHFGIGPRWLEKGHVREIWYQSFHQLPVAMDLVGHSRETCRAYFRHFLAHWSCDPATFDDVLEEWVDNFMKPGRLAGGFRWYAAANERRLRAMQAGGSAPADRIAVPAFSLWGAADPILKAEWRDTLTEVFETVETEAAPEAGHFPHWERPDLAVDRILRFFEGRFGPAR